MSHIITLLPGGSAVTLPRGLQSMGLQRIRHYLVIKHTHYFYTLILSVQTIYSFDHAELLYPFLYPLACVLAALVLSDSLRSYGL